ncbi:hypothetical protein BaRGS_00013204 [Batillaria attramentaria]|uniref:Histone deacetylase domain-containing protein n=1 Tax=Batillaria attramentaria TaxID=370345 RepID=A0ABD0L7H3_9CAEN
MDSKGDGEESQNARGQRRQERERRKQSARQTPQQHSDSDSDTELLMSMASMVVSDDAPLQYLGTGFIYDEVMTRHKCEWDENYPENPARILQPLARCQQLGLVERCIPVPLRYATEDQIQWLHTQSLLEIAKASSATFECSLAAAGSSIELMDQILQKKMTNGFAMVRPPGHHAMQDEFCGYCTFNNAALAATHALNHGAERVLIVDWDVHHGQATQYMFYDDPRVMYFSIHRYEYGEFWPNLRESDYDFIGEGKGKGYNVNVPLNKTGMGDADYMAIFQTLLIPLAYEFSPQVIIISSGYDAAVGCPEFRPQVILVSCGLDSAVGDEKGEMLVTPAAYAHFVHMLSSVCEGRVCTLLEGGYCLQSLAEGCAMTLRSLLGDPCPMLPPLGEPSDSMITTILNVVKVLRPYWNCLQLFDYTERRETCPFEEVHSMPPRDNVEFSTPETQPEENDIMGNYPQQSEETIAKFAREISRLIAETSLAKAANRTCFVFDADMRKHKNMSDSSHPERPKRISAIFEQHREWGLLKRCLILESRRATEEEILEVHRQHYVNDMKDTVTMDEEELEQRPRNMRYNSIYMCKDTYECARLSAGCVLQAVDAVLTGQAQSGVAVVRPPGHHAECHAAMGFCFFNNVAVAAAYAQKKFDVKRILIVDWDVHHGNATQHMFYADPSVLYISLHRYDNGYFFPGSQEADAQFVGQGDGKGFNVNIPWSREKMGNAEYMAAFQRIVMPIAYEYAPELVLVSAGFDAALGDFLGGYKVTPECYGHMTHMLSGLANGKVVLALEGGYNLNSISLSMATCTSVLLGDPCPPMSCGEPNAK